jgi:hypothetical protein
LIFLTLSALTFAYPEIKWASSKVPAGHWESIANRRKFFDDIAKDFSSPHEWLHVTKRDIVNKGGAGMLIKYYGGSIIRALKEVSCVC